MRAWQELRVGLPYVSELPSYYVQESLQVLDIGRERFEARSPSLPRLRELTYSVYTGDGIPITIADGDDNGGVESHFLVAEYTGDCNQLLSRVLSGPIATYQEELRGYRETLGFLRMDIVTTPNGFDKIEAVRVMDWDGWEGERIAYLGSFVVTPLLEHVIKLDVQAALNYAALAIALEKGLAEQIYLLMIEKVYKFATNSGLSYEQINGATIRPDSDVVASLKLSHPKYWQTNPHLYRLSGFNEVLSNE